MIEDAGALRAARVWGVRHHLQGDARARVAAKAGFQFARIGLDEHGLPAVYYELRRPEGTP